MSVAALSMCVAFTGCSHDVDILSPEELNAQQAQKVIKTYEQAFINVFGEPAPDQDWGFGPSSAASRTRGQVDPDNPHVNANANEWADVTNSTGFGGWLVPDPLTPKQKERVIAYFQANPNPDFNDPHLTNFFVQQVYKGGPGGGNTTEVVTAAGGQTYTSDNMNQLTVGQTNVHINNFNYGTATELSVLDNGANIANHTGETYHNDQIMLMIDIEGVSFSHS